MALSMPYIASLQQPMQRRSDKAPFNLKDALLAACATVPENLSAIADNLLDPLGLNIGTVDDIASAASEQEVKTDTFAAMQHSFDGKAGAFAYLLFILLYAPCVAATAAIYRETNTGWTLFVVFWTTGIAYMTATIFYQAMTYSQHPRVFSGLDKRITYCFFIGVGRVVAYRKKHRR